MVSKIRKSAAPKQPIHEVMRGRWGYFFSDRFPDLREAMDHGTTQGPCPVCGGRTRFKFFRDWQSSGGGMCQKCGTFAGGYFLTEWLLGSAKAASRELHTWLRQDARQSKQSKIVRKPIVDVPKDNTKARAYNLKLWTEALPLTEDCPPVMYLRSRGITLPLNQFPSANVMRWHPNAVHRKEDDEEGHIYSRFAALLSKVVKAGKTVALHRIYVLKDGSGKADVIRPKKLTESSQTLISGCAIPLYKPTNGKLGVCEGVETALAVRMLFGMAVWPCISDSFMAAVDWDAVLTEKDAVGKALVTELHIFEDKDVSEAGQNAAAKLQKRAKEAGITVVRHVPKGTIPKGAKSLDFLDNLVAPVF